MLGPTTRDLVGEWRLSSDTNSLGKCSYVSHTELDCEGNKLTLNGIKLTSVNTGTAGTIIKHGSNYDLINWDNGVDWKKQGMYDNNNKFIFFLQFS